MTELKDLTTGQLQRIIGIKEQIESLQAELDSIAGEGETPSAKEAPATARRKYRMTAAHRSKLIKALARARKIRWAKYGGKAAHKMKPAKKMDRRMSPAVKKKLAAIAKARWAKAKAEGKKGL